MGLGLALSPLVQGKLAGGVGGGHSSERVRQGGIEVVALQGIRRAALFGTPGHFSEVSGNEGLNQPDPEMTSGSSGLQLCGLTSLSLPPGSSNACEKTSFTFLRQELPVRLANIMKEINLLPDRVLSTPSVQLVQSW